MTTPMYRRGDAQSVEDWFNCHPIPCPRCGFYGTASVFPQGFPTDPETGALVYVVTVACTRCEHTRQERLPAPFMPESTS